MFDLDISVRGLYYTGLIQTCRAEIAVDGDVGGRLAVCCSLPSLVSVGPSLKSLTQNFPELFSAS